VETKNCRPGLRMAVRRRPKSVGAEQGEFGGQKQKFR